MLGERHSERDESANSNSVRTPESTTSDMFGKDEENLYLNHTEMRPDNIADQGQNSTSANSNAEINSLSSELKSRLSRELDEMSSVNTQIHWAISDAISNQILPQIQNALRVRSGHVTQNRWNVPAERPEIDPEDYRSEETKSNSRSEPICGCLNDNLQEQAYDNRSSSSCRVFKQFCLRFCKLQFFNSDYLTGYFQNPPTNPMMSQSVGDPWHPWRCKNWRWRCQSKVHGAGIMKTDRPEKVRPLARWTVQGSTPRRTDLHPLLTCPLLTPRQWPWRVESSLRLTMRLFLWTNWAPCCSQITSPLFSQLFSAWSASSETTR